MSESASIKEERLLREHPKELSYILGVLCGDGYIAHYHYKQNGKIVSYYVFGETTKSLYSEAII